MKVFWFRPRVPTGNFGDDALIDATVEQMERMGRIIEWVVCDMRLHSTSELMRRVNDCDMVLVGPGGTFMPMEGHSGHQWNISIPHINKIQIPLVVFASGYNCFPGQLFTEKTWDNLRAIREKATVFTLRDPWSVDTFKAHGIDADLCPCPSMFVKTGPSTVDHDRTGMPWVAFNFAGDRRQYRFRNFDKFCRNMKNVAEQLFADASLWRVNHLCRPGYNLEDCDLGWGNFNVRNIEYNWLYERTLHERIRSYKDFDCVVGMRGHGVLIPFGQCVPVIGLSSHDKIRSFYEMVDMGGMCADANDDDFPDLLVSLVRTVLANKKLFETSIADKNTYLRFVMEETIKKIEEAMQ